MLQLFIPETDLFDQKSQEFIKTKSQMLSLEHSLVSISKWEAKWHEPFLNNETKSRAKMIDYIRCMTTTQNVDPSVYLAINNKHIEMVNEYIRDPMTATTFSDQKDGKRSREIITSELIYYWMVTANIPIECQKWHINRLLTLIKICSIKNQPEKKMSMNEIYRRNKALNAARRKKYNSRG